MLRVPLSHSLIKLFSSKNLVGLIVNLSEPGVFFTGKVLKQRFIFFLIIIIEDNIYHRVIYIIFIYDV